MQLRILFDMSLNPFKGSSYERYTNFTQSHNTIGSGKTVTVTIPRIRDVIIEIVRGYTRSQDLGLAALKKGQTQRTLSCMLRDRHTRRMLVRKLSILDDVFSKDITRYVKSICVIEGEEPMLV